MRFRFLAAALTAFIAAPALAQAASGYATANVNMRSGPSTAYPAVVVIPVGARLQIHGCLATEAWCDVSFARGRGWVSGRYIQATYGRDRVYVDRQYYGELGIPTIVFDLGDYWDQNYRRRDFYRERNEWRRREPNFPSPRWNDEDQRRNPPERWNTSPDRRWQEPPRPPRDAMPMQPDRRGAPDYDRRDQRQQDWQRQQRPDGQRPPRDGMQMQQQRQQMQERPQRMPQQDQQIQQPPVQQPQQMQQQPAQQQQMPERPQRMQQQDQQMPPRVNDQRRPDGDRRPDGERRPDGDGRPPRGQMPPQQPGQQPPAECPPGQTCVNQ